MQFMSQRPEILWPLFADLTVLDGIGPKTAQSLLRMDIEKPADMLLTLPASGIDRTPVNSVQDATLPGVVTVEVEVGLHRKPMGKGRPYVIFVRDAATEFQLVFFHPRGDWLQRTFPSGQRRIVSGRVELFDGLAQMTHPDHVVRPAEAASLPRFEPVYPLTQGISQRTMAKATRSALERAPELEEWIEPSLMAKKNWPTWQSALLAAHSPESNADIMPSAPARERLAYDELLAHQITLALARSRVRQATGVASVGTGKLQNAVLASLPYQPTGAQVRAVSEITADMASPLRMNRLLQGDVGSGKTIVAMLSMLAAIEAGGQAAMMAPTGILARQHLDGLVPLAESAGIRIDLLTSRDKGKPRADKLALLADGTTDIMIGTHSLFQADVEFNDLRVAVIDEQHRFGVRQRMDLGSKGHAPDILVMTATPIPRSLSLAQYGDMDISVLDEKPPGRKPVDTVLISSGRTGEVISRLKQAIAEGRQAYWVCPLVHDT